MSTLDPMTGGSNLDNEMRFSVGDIQAKQNNIQSGEYSRAQSKANVADIKSIEITKSKIAAINREIRAVNNRKAAYRGASASRKVLNLELQKYQSLEKAGISLNSKTAQALGLSARKYKAVAAAVANLNKQKSKLLAKGSAGKGGNLFSGGPMDWISGKMSSLGKQATYWGQLRLMYGAYNKVAQGVATFGELMRTTNRAVRTAVDDVNDLNQVLIAHEEIMDGATAYLSKHLGTISDYTEAVHQLTQAEMSRAEALKLAPNIMAAASGLDAPIKDISRLMVGLNEIFRDMDGFDSDSGRINRMLSVMSLAVKKEVTTIGDLRRALGYIGPVAKQANMSFEELVATVALLNTNLFQASRAGTGIRQMLNALSKNADKLAKFGVNVDMSKPLEFARTMQELGQSIGQGALSGDKMKDFLSTFGLRGAAPAAILAQQFESFAKSVRELRQAKLSDLLGMREIMENNVPAQMEILRKNMDLYVATVLRGAIGGRDMSDSLKKINDNMKGIQETGLVVGKTIDTVFINKPALLIPFAMIVMKIATNIKTLGIQASAATIGIEGMTAATASLKRTMMFTKLGIFGVIAAITVLVFWMKKREQQQNAAIKNSRDAAEKNREEGKSFRNKAKELRKMADEEANLKIKAEQLAAAQKDVRDSAASVGEIFDEKLKTLTDVADAYDRLADSSDNYAKAQAARSLRLTEEKYSKFGQKAQYSGAWDALKDLWDIGGGTKDRENRFYGQQEKFAKFSADMSNYVKTSKILGKNTADISSAIETMIKKTGWREFFTGAMSTAKLDKNPEMYNIAAAGLERLNAAAKMVAVSAKNAAVKLQKLSIDAIEAANAAAWKLGSKQIIAALSPRMKKGKDGKDVPMTRGERSKALRGDIGLMMKKKKAAGILKDSGLRSIIEKIAAEAGDDPVKFTRMFDAAMQGSHSIYGEWSGGKGLLRDAYNQHGFGEGYQKVLSEQKSLDSILKSAKIEPDVGVTRTLGRKGLHEDTIAPFIKEIVSNLFGEKPETAKLLEAMNEAAAAAQTANDEMMANTESLTANTDSNLAIAAALKQTFPVASKDSFGVSIPMPGKTPGTSGAPTAAGAGVIILNLDGKQIGKFGFDVHKKLQQHDIDIDFMLPHVTKRNKWDKSVEQYQNTLKK